MNRVGALCALSLSIGLAIGCTIQDRSNPGQRNDPPAANPPSVGAAAARAKNEKDILRYKTETDIADETVAIAKDGTKVKTFPVTGADFLTLTRGTSVTKISRYFVTGVLIVFDDPTTRDGTKLMGWVAPESLTSTPPTTPTLAAPPLTAARFTDAGPRPTPVVADAGGKGQAPPTPPTSPTAPKPPPPPPPPGPAVPTIGPGQLQVLPTDGKCPAGMTVMGPFCRRPCSSDAQCPAGTFCTNESGPKSCHATK